MHSQSVSHIVGFLVLRLNIVFLQQVYLFSSEFCLERDLKSIQKGVGVLGSYWHVPTILIPPFMHLAPLTR